MIVKEDTLNAFRFLHDAHDLAGIEMYGVRPLQILMDRFGTSEIESFSIVVFWTHNRREDMDYSDLLGTNI